VARSAQSTARRHLSGIVVAIAVLTACGGGGDGSTPTRDAPGGNGGTLRLAIGSEPENLDPHALRAGTDQYFLSNVFERLLDRAPDGSLKPALATDYSVSEDGKAFTFTLRQGVRFHNGEEMTAEDVAYSFERYVDPARGNTFAYLLDKLDRVEVVDDHKVIVHLTQFDGSFIPGGGFASIVPKDYVEKSGDAEFAQNPVGTGPLKFVERTIRQSFTLERFPEYWGDPASYNRFEFRIASDANARVAAIRSGAVDLISQVPPQNVQQLESDAKLNVVSGYTAENVWLKFGALEGKPWADPRVRQAMDFAINKDAIIERVLNGLGVPYTGVAPLSSGHDRADYQQRPYDPDQARKLLAEAGYADGFDFTIATPVNGRLPASEQTMQAVAGFLNEVGIRAKVQVLEYSQWIDGIKATPPAIEGALGLHGDQTTYDPQARMEAQLSCGGPYAHSCERKLDQLIDAVGSTVDQRAREDAYLAAFEYVHDQALEIPIYSSEQAYAMSSSVCWKPVYGSPFVQAVFAKPC
jgi:peptide/nickel transport system substrate-binding protein